MSLCVIDIRLCLLLLCISAPLSMNADRTEDDLEVGDPCRITHSAEPGLCALITKCPPVASKAHRQRHTVCGFRGLEPIVCCPLAVDIPALPYIPDMPPVEIHNDDLFPHTDHSTQRRAQRTSSTMCLEYHRMVHENITIQRINGTTIEHRETRCPPFNFPSLLSDRPDAKLWDYPHIALIGYRKNGSINWGCGGALISDEYVLTAAHCVIARDLGRPTVVKLGAHNISRVALFNEADGSEDAVDFPIAQIIPHPEYVPAGLQHDIGLLRLKSRVPLSRQMRPICLPTDEHDDTDTGAVASAWGSTAHWGRPTEVLLEVELEQYTHAACSGSLSGGRQPGIDRRTQLCAVSYPEAQDTCRSDSGGPLQTYYSDSYQPCLRKLIGVTSFGQACGAANSPAVFTRVFAYLPWIESIVWPHAKRM